MVQISDNRENTKRIAKNTILLYVRLLFTMIVSLYTSRVILNTLGFEDYGTYNVVGGVVAMFTFISSSLSAAISRFLTYSLGKNDVSVLRRVFSTSIIIQSVIAVIALVLIELVGIWFLNSKMNIPGGRMYAANWVLQFSIINFSLNLIQVPYNASIIAHEKMGAYAYFSIVEVVCKLLIVYLLLVSPYDKLISYAALGSGVSLLMFFMYRLYCKKQFEECRFVLSFDKTLFKQMTGFAGWNLFGSCAYILNTQGVNIVTNLFFGVTLNAARGIATQVESIVKQFVQNFTTAINPQITKSYARGDMPYMFSLVCQGAKYSYFLMLLFVVPLMFETDSLLVLWLKNVPDYASIFLRLSLIGTLIDMTGNSIANAVWATGKVKHYYVLVGSIGCLVFPLSWLAFKCGFPAYSSYIIFVVVYLVLFFVKLLIVRHLVHFPIRMYLNRVLMRIIPVSIGAFVLPFLFVELFHLSSIPQLVIVISLSLLSTSLSIYYLGLEKSERSFIISKVVSIVNKFKNSI